MFTADLFHALKGLLCRQDWIDFGFPLSTTSDEACKLYDASLSQIVGWYDDKSMGGLSETLKKMLEADPSFVMGHVMCNGIKMTGTKFIGPEDPIRKSVADLVALSEKQSLSSIEKLHVQAIQLLVDSDLTGALQCWEKLLRENPLDMLAIRLAFFGYYFVGQYSQLRDMLAWVLHSWNKSMPLYGYLHGFHAFGLQETNFYDQAEKEARLALELNKYDVYASHSVCHVMEMTGRPTEGIIHLNGSQRDWEVCNTLACHMHWHCSLFHVEKAMVAFDEMKVTFEEDIDVPLYGVVEHLQRQFKSGTSSVKMAPIPRLLESAIEMRPLLMKIYPGNYDEALGIFDSEILPRYKASSSTGNFTDGSSLLYRLKLEGVKVGDRWKELQEGCRSTVEEHLNIFTDPHVLMTCLGSEDMVATTKFMDTLKETVRNGYGYSKGISERIVIPLCEAILAHDNGDYARAVDLTFPIRYDIVNAGGSNAQRDVYNLFLIDSALKSDKREHNSIGRHLLIERKCMKENTPLTDRLMERALAAHVD